MNTPTYKEQFDKITRAYFNNELEPMNSCACFIGNLLNGRTVWRLIRGFLELEIKNEFKEPRDILTPIKASDYCLTEGEKCIVSESAGLYSADDIIEMENNFLKLWSNGGRTEQSLFEAMDSTLDMLRKIHESKGEVIDSFEFKKRELATN